MSISEDKRVVELSGSIADGLSTVEGTLSVIQVDSIKVEDSPTTKYLRPRSGDYECRQSVFVTLYGGEEHEITIDALPDTDQ